MELGIIRIKLKETDINISLLVQFIFSFYISVVRVLSIEHSGQGYLRATLSGLGLDPG